MTDMQNAQNYACLVGDVQTMRRASHAMSAVLDILSDDDTATDANRLHGLLAALDLVAHSLDERADFLVHDVLKEDA